MDERLVDLATLKVINFCQGEAGEPRRYVLDVAEFLRLQLNDGTLNGHRVLSGPSARSMRVVDRPGRPFNHGLGWFREPGAHPAAHAGDTRVEHFGAGAGFWNVARLHPDKGIGIALMTNSTTRPAFEPTLALLASASFG